jgi:hypothetical protein
MGAESSDGRAVYVYTVGDDIHPEIKAVGLVELTAEDEIAATRRARGDQIRLAFELAKQSLAEVDGKRVSLGDGTADRAWNRLGARLRNLVLQAFTEIHTPDEKATDTFRASRKVEVR